MQNHCPPPHDDPSFGLLLAGGFELQRDDDYLRALLQEMEQSDEWMHLSGLYSSMTAEDAKRHFHVLLLVDAGFLAPMKAGGSAFRITNTGHDFLALTRKSETWEATKAASKHLGGASLQMLYRVAEGYARNKLAELGIPLA